jgi:hypothetical protein
MKEQNKLANLTKIRTIPDTTHRKKHIIPKFD